MPVVVHSFALSMGRRRILAVSAIPCAVAFAMSCAPVEIPDSAGGPASVSTGVGGAFAFAATAAGVGGGVDLALDGGAPDAAAVPAQFVSYASLCGGSSATCATTSNSCAESGTGGGPGATSCQLVPEDGGVTARCGLVGPSADGDPCESASDCQPGLGCIDAGVISICRAYCCGDPEACRTGTYCTTASMPDAPSSLIPVCTPVTPCELLDTASCPTGQTCAIVRESGTKSCVVPGTGTANEPCPCAAGFTCSWSEGICLQLCETGDAGVCANGYCEGGGAVFPAGVGTCVSY